MVDTRVNRYSYVHNNPATLADPSGYFLWFPAAVGAVVGGVAGAVGYVVSTVATGQELDLTQGLIATGAGAITGGVCGVTMGLGCVGAGAVTSVVQYELAPGDSTIEGAVLNATVGGVLARLGAGPLVKPRPVTFADDVWPGSNWSLTSANYDIRPSFLLTSGTKSGIAAGGQNLVSGFLLGSDGQPKSRVLEPR